MPAGELRTLQQMMAHEPGNTLLAKDYDFYVSSRPEVFESQVALLGNGECVQLVQAAAAVPVTSLWRKGPRVRGNRAIPTGTAIATFNEAGMYANMAFGNHAAIFLQETRAGLIVVDQWRLKTPATPWRRILRFRNGEGSVVNDGDQYFVILTPKAVTTADLRLAWASLLNSAAVAPPPG